MVVLRVARVHLDGCVEMLVGPVEMLLGKVEIAFVEIAVGVVGVVADGLLEVFLGFFVVFDRALHLDEASVVVVVREVFCFGKAVDFERLLFQDCFCEIR